MRTLVPKLLPAAALCAAALVLAAPALAAPVVTGIFKTTAQLETNNKIVAGPDGNMWFTLTDATKDVAKITPAGVVTEFELPGIKSPTGIAADPEGRLWVVAKGEEVSFLPSNPPGTVKIFESELGAEPNITLGPDGLMWIAAQNKVVKFPPSNFAAGKEVKLTGELAPKDIDTAGSLVVIADNSGLKRIVTFTTGDVQKDFAIKGGSQGVAGAPNGQIAYSDAMAMPEQSGLITPPGPAQSFELLGDPFGVARGADEAFWIAQFAFGGLTRVAPTGARTFLAGLPKESARQVAAGPGNTLWVTLTKMGEPGIARISGVEPPAPVVPVIPTPPLPPPPTPIRPQTSLLKKPEKVVKTTASTATVKFRFRSPTAGAAFECSLARKVKPKGKKPRFVHRRYRSCQSPIIYEVKPGRYRFGVRAVSGGLEDQTPATYGFKVVHVSRK